MARVYDHASALVRDIVIIKARIADRLLHDRHGSSLFGLGNGDTAFHGIPDPDPINHPQRFLLRPDGADLNYGGAGNPDLLRDPVVKDWNQRLNKGGKTALGATMDIITSFTSGNIPEVLLDRRFAKGGWPRTTPWLPGPDGA